ncbi:hypothetical protein BH11PLA2_BH11PLA2_37160 [soil metagenome]
MRTQSFRNTWIPSLFPSRAESAFGLRRRTPSSRLGLVELEGRDTPTNFTAATAADLTEILSQVIYFGGSHTITLTAPAAQPYTFSTGNTAFNACLPITGTAVTIVGNRNVIQRSGDAGTEAFRLFTVTANASLTLQNVTLENGLAAGAGNAIFSSSGGAIYTEGTLTLTDVTLGNNTALAPHSVSYTYNSSSQTWGTENNNGLGGAVAVGGGNVSLNRVTMTRRQHTDYSAAPRQPRN